jgi:hypothetical protein
MAKVALSFPGWKQGRVASAVFEVPVVDPPTARTETASKAGN